MHVICCMLQAATLVWQAEMQGMCCCSVLPGNMLLTRMALLQSC
jgi:hypothetical protein